MKLLVLLLVSLLALPASAQSIPETLQAQAVTVRSESEGGMGQGSGTLIVRKIDGKNIAFVLTAAHVVDNLRKTREYVDSKTGSKKLVVEFADAGIVQEFREEGRRVGETVADAKVLKFSDSETGEDIALLQIRKSNYMPAEVSARFFVGDKIPPVGTELWHVGSLLGQFGSTSVTSGVMSQHGRVLVFSGGPVVFDQTTVTAFPGSSGGGVFLKSDGVYVGMLVRGAGEGFNFIVPIRRVQAWSKRAGVEWLLDEKAKLPTAEELSKMPIEDTDSGTINAHGNDAKIFKTMELRYAITPAPRTPKN